jgi:hypothetical protein
MITNSNLLLKRLLNQDLRLLCYLLQLLQFQWLAYFIVSFYVLVASKI